MTVQELLDLLSLYSSSAEVLISDNRFVINDGYVTGWHFPIDGVSIKKISDGIDIAPSSELYDSATSYVILSSERNYKK